MTSSDWQRWYEPGNDSAAGDPPTRIRYRVIAVSIAMAFILYLDRVCLGEIVKNESFRADFGASKEKLGEVLGAFFFTYALFQVPAGWASDRFGSRRMLTIYIVLWSLMTGITGWASTVSTLLLARLACGVAQAGAYPTSSGVVRRWFPLQRRGIASGWISFGGRLGGTLAPFLTTLLIIGLGSWRSVLVSYFLVGIAVALLYAWIVRDAPDQHPEVNAEELELIGNPPEPQRPTWREFFGTIFACLRNRSLWLNSFSQFGTNVGWTFLITWLPSYLADSQGVAEVKGATMVMLVLAVGMPGQLLGGVLGDAAVSNLGLRWGRVFVPAVALTTAGCAYLACLSLQSVWLIVGCCAIVSLMTDVSNPSTWAFMQDVGGTNTAAVFGWANMWGNFGAAFSAWLVPQLMTWGEASGQGQDLVFIFCGGAFFAAAAMTLGMDATRKVHVSGRVPSGG